MALSDLTPVIDNRTFDDIVAEARARIPRYTPEWTDFNPSDPGIAIVELFAWMSELMIYRLGQTPAMNYIKFLELIGLELRAAQPARAAVTFALRNGFPNPSVNLPERTQIAANGPDGPIVFETERSLTILAAVLDAVQVFDGYSYRDQSAENADIETAFHPFGPSPATDAALLLGFDQAAPFPSETLVLTVWSPQGERAPAATSHCGTPGFRPSAPARLAWEYYTGSDWRPLIVLDDATLAFTRSGEIRLKTPAPGEIAKALVGRIADKPRYWIRARVLSAGYAMAPQLLAVRHNTVGVLQAETARNQIIGGSDGTKDQVFTLGNAPVLAGTLSVEVDEGDGWQPWSQVRDFFASGPNDRHYVLNETTGEVRFGDGDNGAIPVANVDRPGNNIIARHYRFGGGKRGNLAAGTISTLLTAVDGVDAGQTMNLFSAYGGRDEETLAEARKRVPHYLRGRDRAVTADDFEHLATQVGAVRRAVALPRYSPECPDIEVPGAVTVIVVPDSEGATPTPSDALIRDVCAFLNERRLLTTELYVRPPAYVQVRISAEIVATPETDSQGAQVAADAAIRTYLDPFVGGDGGTGWPFGGTIFYSALYRKLMVEGVQRVASLKIEVDGEIAADCADVPIPRDALIAQLDHDIRAVSDDTASTVRI